MPSARGPLTLNRLVKGEGGSSLGDRVYQALRTRISEGEFAPGTRLREIELATALGISRTPVREALKRLEADGLIADTADRGLIVAELNETQALELYALREVLEGAAARFAAQHASTMEIELLRDLLREERTAGEDPERRAMLNRRFHQALYRAAHNRYLMNVLEQARGFLILLKGTTYLQPGRAATASAEHEALVAAIEARDLDAAEAAARTHIRHAQRVRLRLEFGLD